jgi:DNA-directed RNA polymerase specialized sigma24 family protein
LAIDVERLYRRYGPVVFRRCHLLLRDEARAAEALRDVFVRWLRSSEGAEDEAPAPLLHRLATRVCLERLRSTRREPENATDALVLRIAAAPESEVRGVWERLLGRPPVSGRELAVLHLVDGMTLEETAREVGLSVSAVRERLRGIP